MLTEHKYTEMLEYAFQDEAEAIEYYQNFIDSLPAGEDFRQVRKALQHILDEEKQHLNTLATFIDTVY